MHSAHRNDIITYYDRRAFQEHCTLSSKVLGNYFARMSANIYFFGRVYFV